MPKSPAPQPFARPCPPFSPARVDNSLVRASAETPAPLDDPRTWLGYQATFLPPIGAATRSNSRCALPHLIAPRGAPQEGTGAAALCPCHAFLSPPFSLMRGLCQSLRSWREAAVPLLPLALCGRSFLLVSIWNVMP